MHMNENKKEAVYKFPDDSFMEQFIYSVGLKWIDYPKIENDAFFTEIILFEIVSLAIYCKTTYLSHMCKSAQTLAVHFLTQKFDSGEINQLENIYFQRFLSYNQTGSTNKKHEHLYRFCQWASIHGHKNAVRGNYAPKIDSKVFNDVVDNYNQISNIRIYDEIESKHNPDTIFRAFTAYDRALSSVNTAAIKPSTMLQKDTSPQTTINTSPQMKMNLHFDFIPRTKGRLSRSHFWPTYIVSTICLVISLAIINILNNEGDFAASGGTLFLYLISCLVMLASGILGLSLTVRRFHDIGISGNWILLVIFLNRLSEVVPALGVIVSIVLIIVLCLPSQKEPNKWGFPVDE